MGKEIAQAAPRSLHPGQQPACLPAGLRCYTVLDPDSSLVPGSLASLLEQPAWQPTGVLNVAKGQTPRGWGWGQLPAPCFWQGPAHSKSDGRAPTG